MESQLLPLLDNVSGLGASAIGELVADEVVELLGARWRRVRVA